MLAGTTMTTDTIVAQATAPGAWWRRYPFGPTNAQVALGNSQVLKPRYMSTCLFNLHNGTELDQGVHFTSPNPHSFTGEDVLLELQGHGGPVVMDMLIKRILSIGCTCRASW